MNAPLVIAGAGAVSAAGWGLPPLLEALSAGSPLPTESLGEAGFRVRRVPKPTSRPGWGRLPRMRRASPITRFGVGSALEALGLEDPAAAPRVAVVAVVMDGSVQYSGRFYREVLEQPATASPILFPETVFNAPGSHLATLLGADGPSATLVGDPAAQCVGGLELARQWLDEDPALDGVVLVALEELDEVSAAGLALLDPQRVASEGAAALWLRRDGPGPRLHLEAESFALDVAELRADVAGWPRLPDAGGWVRNGGRRLPRERVLDSVVAAEAVAPHDVLGELFAVSSVMGLACGAALLQRSPSREQLRVVDPGAWHGGFQARLSLG